MAVSVRPARRLVRAFASDQGGAITIDWVSVTAGILLLGIATVWAIFQHGVYSATDGVNGSLKGIEIAGTGPAPDLATRATGVLEVLEEELFTPLFDFLSTPLVVGGELGNALVVGHDAGMELTQGTVRMSFTTGTVGAPGDGSIDNQAIFSKDQLGYVDGGHLTVWLEDDTLRVRLQEDGASHYVDATGFSFESNQDYDVAVSFGDQGMQVAVDGAVVATNTSYTGGIEASDAAVVIGASSRRSTEDGGQLQWAFDGTITSVSLDGEQLGAGS